MKIRKLHIKNYKVFDDIELDFTDANGKTLDKIVLAGVNGCGKTTVLELIRKMYDVSFDYEYHKRHGSLIEAEFELSKEEKKSYQPAIEYLSEMEVVTILQSNESQLIFSIPLHYESTFPFFEATEITRYQLIYMPVATVNKRTSHSKMSKKSIKFLHLSSDKDEMKTLALKDIRNEIFKNEDIAPRKSKEKAIKRITKALEGLTLTTKLVDLESEELIFESANGQKIKFEDLSSGEQTLYFRAIYLSTLNPQNSIIMIDEPEDSLHPTWQQKVMQLYQNIGENNQVIVATHSPHIIGSSKAEEVFLLQIDENKIEARHPRYTKGHSIDYVLDEIMDANSRDTSVIKLVDSYLALMRKGQHESAEGLKIKSEIDALNLDPNSEEMRGLNLSIKRIKAVGV
jgi:predicted ATP-binding protein involved in virulence